MRSLMRSANHTRAKTAAYVQNQDSSSLLLSPMPGQIDSQLRYINPYADVPSSAIEIAIIFYVCRHFCPEARAKLPISRIGLNVT